MKQLTVLQTFGPIDLKSVGRDQMLRWMTVLPVVMALAMRWVLPVIIAAIDPWLPVDLPALFQPLMGYMFLLMIPYLWGILVGFLLLDQRDDGTLVALQVTPLPLHHYLLYRLGIPALLSVLSTLLVYPLANIVQLQPGAVLLLALVASPQAPLFALMLAALAQNKVQGLALTKAAGVVLLPPLVAYFLPAAWQWPFAIFPTYWPGKLLWAMQAGDRLWPLYLVVGLFYQLMLLVLLARRFDRIIHR